MLDAVVAVIYHQSQAPEPFHGIIRGGMGEMFRYHKSKAIQGDDDTLGSQQL